MESYTYRSNEMASYFVPERVTRRLMADLARTAVDGGRRYAFTLGAGVSLAAPPVRLGAVHCYLEGDPAPIAAALGLHPARRGRRRPASALTVVDPGVFYSLLDKAGLKVVCLPQLYADLMHWDRRGPEQAEHLRREAMGF